MDRTAIKRQRPSLPMQWLYTHDYLHGKMLDFGSGHGKDAQVFGMDAYDPYHGPYELPDKTYDVITAIYVLNVVSDEMRGVILNHLFRLTKRYGSFFIAVRRDLPLQGQPGAGGVRQRYVQLPSRLSLTRNSKFEIYRVRN